MVGPGQHPAARAAQRPVHRQLHDIVVPQLFALSTGLAALERRATSEDVELIRDLAEVATHALADLRAISRGDLSREGGELERVAGRLRLATTTLARVTDCTVELTVSGEAAVPPPLEDDLVAVTWESVANAMRHGKATRVVIELRAEEASLSVVVTDNGTWAEAHDADSSGLAGIHDRAAAWNGRAMVDHGEGSTKVVWRIPLDGAGQPLTRG